MCLQVKDGEFIRIADEDIVVYKWIKRGWNCWRPQIHRENNPKFRYNRPIVALDENKNPIKHLNKTYGFISKGFHSTTAKDSFIDVICIIPTGAEYCYGTENDIVSTKLIVFRHIWNYWWYKLFVKN